MTALFCHDHRFVISEGRALSPGALNPRLFARYERVFGPVTVAARARQAVPGEDLSRYTPAFGGAERLIAIPDLSNLASLIFSNPQANDLLRDAVARHDMIVARLPSEIGLLALKLARRAGKPAIVEVVGSARDALSSHGAPGARLYAPLADRRMRRAVARADYVHYVSTGFLQRAYPTRGFSVGVSDVQIERPEPEVLERRLATITDDRPVVFGMVGMFTNMQKGVDVVIKALAKARESDASLTLKILGPGDMAPFEALVRELGVADAVEFCGAAPGGDAVLAWIDGIDVYVQASFQEGLPRALIEAMRQATPALASNAGGTFELIERAWLHRPGDAEKLADQMLAVRPAARRAAMARRNFDAAMPYSLDEVARKREDFWQKVLAHSGACGAED